MIPAEQFVCTVLWGMCALLAGFALSGFGADCFSCFGWCCAVIQGLVSGVVHCAASARHG